MGFLGMMAEAAFWFYHQNLFDLFLFLGAILVPVILGFMLSEAPSARLKVTVAAAYIIGVVAFFPFSRYAYQMAGSRAEEVLRVALGEPKAEFEGKPVRVKLPDGFEMASFSAPSEIPIRLGDNQFESFFFTVETSPSRIARVGYLSGGWEVEIRAASVR